MASYQNKLIIGFLRISKAMLFDRERHINDHRRMLERVARILRVPKGVSYRHVVCDGIPAEWITPVQLKNDVTILYFHGGGYAMGSIDSHRHLITHLAIETGSKVLAINYRLAPENPFPSGIEDAVTSYKWLLKQGRKPSKIVICGDSAGAGLTITALITLRDEGIPLPAAGICISPWTDLTASGESVKTHVKKDPLIDPKSLEKWAKMYTDEENFAHHLVSPLHAELKGLPPLLVHVGDAEILLDDSVRFVENARKAGVEVDFEIWKEMIHVWHFYGGLLPEAKQAIKKIAEYIKTKTEN